uniref:EGF-like domain-containing protein n=1 Tax=Strongyloides stercoralis TaxID=6248 RepID=A0A0K0ERL6_STRER
MLVKVFVLTIIFSNILYYSYACRNLKTNKISIDYVLGHELIIKSNTYLNSSLWNIYGKFGKEEIIFNNNIMNNNNPLLSRFIMINESSFLILFIEGLYKIESINNFTCSQNIYHFIAKPLDKVCNKGLPYISMNKSMIKHINCFCPYSTKGRFCENVTEECSTSSLIIPMSLLCVKQSKYFIITFGWILVFLAIVILTIVLLRHSKKTTIFIAPFVDDRPFVYHLEHHQRCLYFDKEENELCQKLEIIIKEIYKEKGVMNYHI